MKLGSPRQTLIDANGATFLCTCGEWATLGNENRPEPGYCRHLEVHCACGRAFIVDWFNMTESVHTREVLPEPPSYWQRFKLWLFPKHEARNTGHE